MKRLLRRTGLLCALLWWYALPSCGQEYFFYKGYGYGTQANYSPLSIMMNGSFDILQMDHQNTDLFSRHYATGAENVWENITHPFSRISQYGWNGFLMTEVIPQKLEPAHSQYWPNYKLHLLGGGMTYIATAEWYAYHGFAYPKTSSAVTMAAYHYLNEIVENDEYRGPAVDPIADLLIFDPLGILFFSIEGVPKFFSETLQMADWSFQPIIDPRHGTLMNNGQTFSYKIPLPGLDRWRLFYLTGIEGLLGLTYRYTGSDNITVGGGFSGQELIAVENTTGVRVQTTTLVWTGGLFYDRNNSLLASLIVKGHGNPMVRLNIYPGVFDVAGAKIGAVGLIDQNMQLSLGLSLQYIPAGLGFTL